MFEGISRKLLFDESLDSITSFLRMFQESFKGFFKCFKLISMIFFVSFNVVLVL